MIMKLVPNDLLPEGDATSGHEMNSASHVLSEMWSREVVLEQETAVGAALTTCQKTRQKLIGELLYISKNAANVATCHSQVCRGVQGSVKGLVEGRELTCRPFLRQLTELMLIGNLHTVNH
jgi:hypothetical protein